MRIATWNINSVRQRLEHLLAYLKEQSPDVLCLQEIKCQDEAFPRLEIEAAGYNVYVHGQKTFNGVAILSKHPLEDVSIGIAGFEDEQKRVISATVEGVRIVCIYIPNGQAVDSPSVNTVISTKIPKVIRRINLPKQLLLS
jgi:exodeoxyribonuclease-3